MISCVLPMKVQFHCRGGSSSPISVMISPLRLAVWQPVMSSDLARVARWRKIVPTQRATAVGESNVPRVLR